MLVTTANDLPGLRITRTIGVVRGITVRSRNLVSDAIGGVQSMLGGRVGAYVKLAETARSVRFVGIERDEVRRSTGHCGHVKIVRSIARPPLKEVLLPQRKSAKTDGDGVGNTRPDPAIEQRPVRGTQRPICTR